MRKFLQTSWVLMVMMSGGAAGAEPQTANYSSEQGKFLNIRPDRPLNAGFWDMVKVAYTIFFDGKARAPKVRLPEAKPDLSHFLAASEHFKFVWFGHSTLMLNLDGKVVLVDPVFSNNASPFGFLTSRFQPPALAREELPAVDAIIISHDHYDHLDKATVRFFSNTATTFIVPLKIGDLLRDWGVPDRQIVELNWNETHTLGDVSFTATVAHHFSGRGPFDRGKTLWASWVIKGKNESIYYSGDTAYTDHFKQIGEAYGPFDYAFIENGQYNIRWPDAHMQPEESVQAAIDVGAKAFIPVHWGMFDISLHHWAEPVVRSSRIAAERGLPYLSPILGQLVDTEKLPEFTPWWEAVMEQETSLSRD